jgi:acyl dehydratase
MWFEDIVLGEKRDLGSYTFTEDAMIDFARKYDPQPFHIDPEAAKHSMFGGLIASGWHTAAVWMKLMVASRPTGKSDGAQNARYSVSPGFEMMRWLKPVRPGMTLRYSTEIAEKIDLKSRPELGLVKSRNEARNEVGELVLSFIGMGFIHRRPKGDAK